MATMLDVCLPGVHAIVDVDSSVTGADDGSFP